jgi:hypothetical protein
MVSVLCSCATYCTGGLSGADSVMSPVVVVRTSYNDYIFPVILPSTAREYG